MSWASRVSKTKGTAPEATPQLVRSKELEHDNIKTEAEAAEAAAAASTDAAAPVAAAESTAPKEKKYGGKKILVLDTGALIKGSGDLAGRADEFTTIEDVMAEVRDRKTRNFVESFPFDIVLREPSKESIKAVVDVAKTTGDFGTLSRTDLRVLALAHMIASENGDVRPPPKVEGVKPGAKLKPVVNTARAGTAKNASVPSLPGWGSWDDGNDDAEEDKDEEREEEPEQEDAGKDSGAVAGEAKGEDDAGQAEGETDGGEEQASGAFRAEEGDEEDVENAEEVDGGWITPANIRHLSNGPSVFGDDKDDRTVGCMTTDFAMQNVLLHAGVLLVNVEGYRVKHLKQWILRCHGCYCIVKDTTKQFCPDCGSGDTLKRVSYSVNDKGEEEIWINPKKRINIRGTIYNLPKPRGGRNGTNQRFVLREDQLLNCGKKNRGSADREAEHVASLLSDDWMFAGGTREKKPAQHVKPTKSSYSKKNVNNGRKRKV